MRCLCVKLQLYRTTSHGELIDEMIKISRKSIDEKETLVDHVELLEELMIKAYILVVFSFRFVVVIIGENWLSLDLMKEILVVIKIGSLM